MSGSRRIAVTLGVAAAAFIASVQAAGAVPPSWSSVKVQGLSAGVPWTEPRITTGPDGTLWLITNGETSSDTAGGGSENTAPAIVMYSTDGGNTWHKTATDFAGQTQTTPDVDIITLPTGRVIGSELDTAGIDFPGAVTDDRGKTWTNSQGTNTLADQDRQWLAAGKDPTTGKERVYLLFHNLASGNANHNMFVAPSDDGGKTFGVPVPITTPGDDAYNDLQCADSGGPSTIFVNQRDGTVYAEFTTRGTPFQGSADLGGCATPLAGQPLEFNIVAGTRIWFAQSKDGGRTWTKSLPVDDAETGQIVSMQVAYAGLDTAGNVYVAYPESPPGKKYPDYSGAGVKYKWAAPANSAADLKWSPARVFEPSDPNSPGHVLVHMTVGDPGQIMGMYWEGETRPGKANVWHMKSAQTLNGLSDNPTVEHARISEVPTDTGTASELMGACVNAGPISGIIAGLFCSRSPDVWGVTIDNRCMTHIVWPATDVRDDPSTTSDDQTAAAGSDPGTFVSNQTGGEPLCGSHPAATGGAPAQLPPNAVPASQTACPDRLAPVSRINRRKSRFRANRLSVRGTSKDRACKSANSVKPASGVARVDISVARVRGKGRGRNCRFLTSNGTLTAYRNCRRPVLLHARGTKRWSFALSARLPRGSYRIVARGTDLFGNKEHPARRRNISHFRVR